MAKTYADLKADIAINLNRSDLTSVIPSFVTLAETDIFRSNNPPLRVMEMDTDTVLTVTSLTATVPTDFLSARMVKYNDANQTTIFYEPPNSWNKQKSTFTIINNYIALPNDATSDILFAYCAQPAALVNDSDTNSVLDNYYGIYLYSALKYAANYIKDYQAGQVYAAQAMALIDGAVRNNQVRNAGPLMVRVG